MPDKKTRLETAERIADAVTKIPDDKQAEVISYIEGVVAGVEMTQAKGKES